MSGLNLVSRYSIPVARRHQTQNLAKRTNILRNALVINGAKMVDNEEKYLHLDSLVYSHDGV